MYCKQCGKQITSIATECPYCHEKVIENIPNSNNNSNNSMYNMQYVEENNKGIAIAGFALGIISFFIFPILGILSIIFGAIAIGTNENNESWNKAIWQYENKALGFGRCSLIFGIIDIIWMVANYYILMNNI